MSDQKELHVVRLQAENIKRLHAVDITPDPGESIVIIGGKNRQGKSSVIDALAYALGGKDLVPAEPIRQGESEAKIEVDLGELIVIRKFKRERFACNCDDAEREITNQHNAACASNSWGETKSSLAVKLKDSGAGYSSPQTILDKLVGTLAFDPLAFAQLASSEPKKADAMLRRLVGIDTTIIDDLRKKAVMNRTAYKKTADELTAQLTPLKRHEDAPAQEISMEEISSEMAEAERLRQVKFDAQRNLEGWTETVRLGAQQLEVQMRRIEQLRHDLAEAITKHEQMVAGQMKLEADLATAQVTQEVAAKNVPDMDTLKKRLTEVEATNRKVRDNTRYAELANKKSDAHVRWDAENQTIAKLDTDKNALLANAKFPVPGLGVNDDGITLNNVPFEQASMSEQLEVSVAIALALNPRLRIMLVRNGNVLDDDSLKKLAQLATDAKAQVWLEVVTGDMSDVSIMIEDGNVSAVAGQKVI